MHGASLVWGLWATLTARRQYRVGRGGVRVFVFVSVPLFLFVWHTTAL